MTATLKIHPAAERPELDLSHVSVHHDEPRRQRLTQIASSQITWHRASWQWIDGDPAVVDAFRRMLLTLDRYQDLLHSKRLARTGAAYGNAIQGLAALAFHHKHWIRPPESWTSTPSLNGHPQRIDQFGALTRHLFAAYDVPTFLDEVWFGPRDEEAERRQRWFIHLGAGGSVRDLDLPVKLTRRMAHQFMQGRNRDSVDHNLRWAQVLGMGGDQAMARTVLSTRLGRHLDHDDFWQTVILFLATHPLIDPAQVGPMIDYVHNMRFAPRRIVGDGGGVEEAPPPQPDFTMKGRSATKLLRQVDEWHGHLAKADVVFQSWQPAGFRPFELEEAIDDVGPVRWTVQELLSSWELAAEGTAMGHCVVSYSDQCADGKTSVWSIGLLREGEAERQGVMTVAVDVRKRSMTQARGKYNLLPNQTPRSAQARDAVNSSYGKMLNRSEYILQRWMERERVRRDD